VSRSFVLCVVAPDRSVTEEPVVSVIAPGQMGYFGVLAGHEPIVAGLKPGLLEYETESGQRQFVAIGGGFLETDGARVTVLADSAERALEIDVTRAERALEKARAALHGEDSTMSREEAVEAIERAMTRLKAAKSP
jgi:F-type H+-transporting ATPase subunit epsilon